MIFDCHAYIGHYPFRPLRYNSGDGLLRLMDSEGIDRAAVGSISALFYRDVQAANEELAQEVAGHQDRLTPLATLNPAYPDCDHDFDVCFGALEMKGVILCPTYHNFALDEARALSLMRRAAERSLPIFVRVQVEDPRKQHRLVQVPSVPVEQIASALRKLPQANFVLLGMGGGMLQLRDLLDGQRNFYADFTRAEVFSYWDFSVGWLIDNLGTDRLLFGTAMPFDVARISRVKLDALDLPADVWAEIAGQNLARLFKKE